MIEKSFKNLDEQVDIFKHKGMIIRDEKYAKQVLLRENYFFLNGYRHLFLKSEENRTFKEGTTFEEMYSLFLFDRSFRNVLFKYLLVIENNLKSIISYQLSKKYGYKEREYLKEKNFTKNPEKQAQVNDLLRKMKRQIRVNGSQHSATQHYVSNYGYIPLWILVKVLSFGIVSEMYSILKPEDQKDIANIYGVDSDVLMVYLPILANYRNLCAHEDILYEHRTQRNIPDTKYHYQLDIPKYEDEYIYGKNDLYSVVIILKQMLTEREFRNFVNEISYEVDYLEGRVKTIKKELILDKIGFPCNWRDILNIN